MYCQNCKSDFQYNKDKPLIVLGVPSVDSVIHHSILPQWNYLLTNYRAIFICVDKTYIDTARNLIVKNGMKMAEATYGQLPDYFLFVDSDTVIARRDQTGNGSHSYSPEYLDLLLERGVNIVSGHYVRKNDSLAQRPVFGKGHPQDVTLYVNRPDNLVEADWIGFGYVLVKAKVFEKIKFPWFSNRADTTDGIDGIVQWTGEDVYFCRKAIENGFKIHVDLNVKLGHHGSVAWPPDE